MDANIVYFENAKAENTEVTLSLTKVRLSALGIKKLVLASTTGATARKAVEFFKDTDVKLIIVPHQFGFRETNPFPPELVTSLRQSGHEVHFATMLFHTDELYGSGNPTALANVLRCFSEGTKVCFEIVLMATDAGLVARGETVIAVAGTGRGSDTALVMQAASSRHLEKLRVNEIICKPLHARNTDEKGARPSQETV
jgi:uncharacterized protein